MKEALSLYFCLFVLTHFFSVIRDRWRWSKTFFYHSQLAAFCSKAARGKDIKMKSWTTSQVTNLSHTICEAWRRLSTRRTWFVFLFETNSHHVDISVCLGLSQVHHYWRICSTKCANTIFFFKGGKISTAVPNNFSFTLKCVSIRFTSLKMCHLHHSDLYLAMFVTRERCRHMYNNQCHLVQSTEP